MKLKHCSILKGDFTTQSKGSPMSQVKHMTQQIVFTLKHHTSDLDDNAAFIVTQSHSVGSLPARYSPHSL